MSTIIELSGGRAIDHGISMLVDHGAGSGDKMYVVSQTDAQVAAGTSHENSTDEGTLSVYTIPANTLVAGSTIRFYAAGVVEDNNGSDTLKTLIRLGTSTTDRSNTQVFTSAAVDVADADIYCWQGIIQIRTAGSSGTAVARASYQDPDETGTAPKWNYKSSFAVDTTSALRVAVTGDWSAANADNEANSEIFVVDIVNPLT